MDRSTAANNLTRLAMVEYTAHELEFIKLLVGDIVTEDDKQVCRLDVAKMKHSFPWLLRLNEVKRTASLGTVFDCNRLTSIFLSGYDDPGCEPVQPGEDQDDAQHRRRVPPQSPRHRTVAQEDKQTRDQASTEVTKSGQID